MMSLSPADFEYIRGLVRRRSAIVLDDDKTYLAEARLEALARREGLDSSGSVVARLRSAPDGDLLRKVVEAMTTSETSFFRDGHPFEALRDVVLPDLVGRRAAARCLRVWCGACSTGQEPYSVAMLLCEQLPALAGWDVRVLGSDLAADALERARRGRYSQLEVNRGLPARFLGKYFEKTGADWQVKDGVRRLVEFRQLNLAGPWSALPPLDLVLLRNVLIYFDVPTKVALLGKVRQAMRPDGYLFLGGAETTLHLDDSFERVQVGRAVCYRLSGARHPAGAGALVHQR